MHRLILGTAGHIDHGKTALVAALTGVDTDRLKEEKARGITIELGFAELQAGPEVHFGVVDVPGHEGFVRTMVAGASGMDVVLLVVAGDEGVMPQTREHLAIVQLLEVPQLVVAITKADLVDEDWLELVRDDVADLLDGTPYAGAPMIPVAALEGRGLDELREALATVGSEAAERSGDDLTRLPVDRVFSVKGTGTVVTGTLWSGTLKSGDRVRLLPEGIDARVRGLQVHGSDVDRALPGDRTAVALTGSQISAEALTRGSTAVTHPTWPPSPMLTVHLQVLPDSAWKIEHRQRVRVHLGTVEVLARVALMGPEAMEPGGSGWAQLRLEEPLVARAGDRFVIRSYSPVTTIGGGEVVEPLPPRRRVVHEPEDRAWAAIRMGESVAALGAVLDLQGWAGAPLDLLPVLTGLPPGGVAEALAQRTGDLDVAGRRLHETRVHTATDALLAAVDSAHTSHPHRPGATLEALRTVLPGPLAAAVADALLSRLEGEGAVTLRERIVARTGFTPTLTPAQKSLSAALLTTYREAGLAPPARSELPDLLGAPEGEVGEMLDFLIGTGALVTIDESFLIPTEKAHDLQAAVRAGLAGRTGLGPADFREVIPVTRKHLMPLLQYLDLHGVTLRGAGGTRDVSAQ